MTADKCTECHIGRCHPLTITYMHRLGPHMVVLPGAPASRCDICGNVHFDADFVETMQALIETLAHDPAKKSPDQSPVKEPATDWAALRDGR